MAATQYRRIHVGDSADYPLIYQLLESYITNPQHALTVKELIFCPPPRDYRHWYTSTPEWWHKEAWFIAEAERKLPEQSIVHRGIKKLGLSTEDEQQWLRVLTWMSPELSEQRKTFERKPDSTRADHEHFKFVSDQNHHFAYRATALLSTLCPNIERLVYRDNELYENPFKETLRRNNYGMLPDQHLQKLKDVVILGSQERYFSDVEYYTPTDILQLLRMFHRLPNIENLSGEAMDNPEQELEDTFAPGTSNLKSISFTHCEFGSDVLAGLIRVGKAMESITITTGGRTTVDSGYSQIFAKEIGKALLCQKSSLVKLDLDVGRSGEAHCYEFPEDMFADHSDGCEVEKKEDDDWHVLESRESVIDEMEARGPLRVMKLPDDRSYGVYGELIGSFHDFEKLTHLSIDIHLFYDLTGWGATDRPVPPPYKFIDILPPNLEYLLIRGYWKGDQAHVDEQIAEFLSLKSERFPMLAEIHGIEKLIPKGERVDEHRRRPGTPWVVKEIDHGWLEHKDDET